MALSYEGVEYRTIADVKERFRVSEKSLKRWIKNGNIPSPRIEAQGGRTFRSYDDDWCKQLEAFLEGKKKNGS